MIVFASFNDLKTMDMTLVDELWCIVRSLKYKPNIEGVTVRHVPELSPSTDLFLKYIKWRDSGEWNEDMFREKYVPQFLYEMQHSPGKEKLEELFERGQEKLIVCVCYCKEESLCHRSIVLGILQGMYKDAGLYVRCEGEDFTLDDYSEYYDMYCDLDTGLKDKPVFYCLVAGSREFSDYNLMCRVLDKTLADVKQHARIVIVSGGARGADKLAERYASERGYESKVFPADWNKYNSAAGFIRNKQMHEFIAGKKRGCVCFWNGSSSGTAHNFRLAKEGKTPIVVYNYKLNRYLSKREIEACIF